MLSKTIGDQPIRGIKIREQSFYKFFGFFVFWLAECLFFLLPFPIVMRASFGIYAIFYSMGLGVLLAFGLTAFRSRTVRCVLTLDRLYFFGARVEETRKFSRCIKVAEGCDGSMLYADIQKTERISENRACSSVIFYGDNFRVRVPDAGLWLLWRLKAMRKRMLIFPESAEQSPADTEQNSTTREGLWKDIWSACESGVLERRLDELGALMQLDMNEAADTIDICIGGDEGEFAFQIDCKRIFMLAVNSDAENTVRLSRIPDLDSLMLLMRQWISKNAGRES